MLRSFRILGGLVELATRRERGDPVPTRVIGDPSTGTESSHSVTTPTRKHPSAPDFSMSGSETPQRLTMQRPSHVELPKPPTFSSADLIPSISTPQPLPDGNLSSSISSPQADGADTPVRVLVVDDDPLTRKLMKRMLTRLGCRVSTAENGAVALDLIMGDRPTPSSEEMSSPSLGFASNSAPLQDEPRYEVVFLDNQMPVLSGLDTVSKLREAGRSDFVVGVTGSFVSEGYIMMLLLTLR